MPSFSQVFRVFRQISKFFHQISELFARIQSFFARILSFSRPNSEFFSRFVATIFFDAHFAARRDRYAHSGGVWGRRSPPQESCFFAHFFAVYIGIYRPPLSYPHRGGGTYIYWYPWVGGPLIMGGRGYTSLPPPSLFRVAWL